MAHLVKKGKEGGREGGCWQKEWTNGLLRPGRQVVLFLCQDTGMRRRESYLQAEVRNMGNADGAGRRSGTARKQCFPSSWTDRPSQQGSRDQSLSCMRSHGSQRLGGAARRGIHPAARRRPISRYHLLRAPDRLAFVTAMPVFTSNYEKQENRALIGHWPPPAADGQALPPPGTATVEVHLHRHGGGASATARGSENRRK